MAVINGEGAAWRAKLTWLETSAGKRTKDELAYHTTRGGNLNDRDIIAGSTGRTGRDGGEAAVGEKRVDERCSVGRKKRARCLMSHLVIGEMVLEMGDQIMSPAFQQAAKGYSIALRTDMALGEDMGARWR